MTWTSYKVSARLRDPFSETEHVEIVEALGDIGAECEQDGDDLCITYEASGNVDAIQHTRSLLGELQDLGLEAGSLTIETGLVETVPPEPGEPDG